MKEFLSRSKSAAFLLATGVLLLGLLAGLNLRSVNKVQAESTGASTDYFLKIDGVDGESTDDKHKGEIELDSYAWSKDEPGLQQAGAAGPGGGRATKVQLHDMYFSKKVDKASPLLMQSTANGKHFKEAVLTVRKAGKGQQQFMVVKLSDVLISSYRTTGHDQSLPTDDFSLNFAKIEFSYFPQKADGSLDAPVVGTWDFKANR
jgi:type VI secretion system secreted protein Hcp